MDHLEHNPAERALTRIPPALLQDLVDNPRAMDPTYRIMIASVADATFRKIQDPNTPISQRIQFMDQLAKLSDAYPKANAAALANAGGPALSVQIIFNKPTASEPAKAEVIEATTVEVKEATAPEGLPE